MNTENSKTNEPHRFRLSLTDKFNFKNPNCYWGVLRNTLIKIKTESMDQNWNQLMLF